MEQSHPTQHNAASLYLPPMTSDQSSASTLEQSEQIPEHHSNSIESAPIETRGSSFFRLPREIRDVIYGQVLKDATIENEKRIPPFDREPFRSSSPMPPQVPIVELRSAIEGYSLVSKQLCAELKTTLYQEGFFWVSQWLPARLNLFPGSDAGDNLDHGSRARAQGINAAWEHFIHSDGINDMRRLRLSLPIPMASTTGPLTWQQVYTKDHHAWLDIFFVQRAGLVHICFNLCFPATQVDSRAKVSTDACLQPFPPSLKAFFASQLVDICRRQPPGRKLDSQTLLDIAGSLREEHHRLVLDLTETQRSKVYGICSSFFNVTMTCPANGLFEMAFGGFPKDANFVLPLSQSYYLVGEVFLPVQIDPDQ